MNTNTLTHRIGSGAAILIGFAIVLTPVTVHASEIGAAATGLQARFVPSDLDPRGRHVVRQLAPSDTDIASGSQGPTLRQLIEADRIDAATTVAPGPTLRQLMEADRGEVSLESSGPTLRQQMEADRSEVLRGGAPGPTLRQLMEADR